ILAACDMLLKLLAMVEGGAAPERGDFNRLVRALDIASVVPASGAGAAPALEPEPEAAPAPPHVRPQPADLLAPLPTAPGATAAPCVADAARDAAAPGATRGEASEAAAGAKPTVRRGDQTVKVNTSRMDNLVTMVGELVIAQQMVVQDAASI